jgi:hypothetical protein
MGYDLGPITLRGRRARRGGRYALGPSFARAAVIYGRARTDVARRAAASDVRREEGGVRRRSSFVVAVALASWGARAAAADPAAGLPPGAADTAPPATPAPAGDAVASAVLAAPAPPEGRRGYQAIFGVGYYERVHAGVAYDLSRTSSLGLFAGTDFGLGDDSTWSVGLSYGHALRKLPERFELGLVGKAVYWQQSSPDYDWQMMSLVLGASVARELSPGLALALEGGAALSFSLATERKQNVNYEYPTRWNGSVSLALRCRFDRW